jgi:crotonobetainyl-CoA:carnitine CoA-transferase CaiB-like acyl-CoA transferase
MLGLGARLLTGKGQYLETTMMNSIVYCNSDDAFDYDGKPPRVQPDQAQLGLHATYRLYQAQDGWVFLAALWDDEFQSFCTAAGCEALLRDARFSSVGARYEHRAALAVLLEPVMRSAGATEWERRLIAAGVGCVRADAMGHKRFLHEDRHTMAIGFMVPTRHSLFKDQAPDGMYWRHQPVTQFSATPCAEGNPYVTLGEQTRPILEELGYDGEEIARLKDSQVVNWPAEASAEPAPRGRGR